MSKDKRQMPSAASGGQPNGAGYAPQGYGYAQTPAYNYPQQQQPQAGAQPGFYQNNMQMPQMQQMQQAQQQPGSGASNIPGMLPTEQSYIENILRLNRGKRATVYMTFEGNDRWNAMIFKGIIEAAGRDHIILSDPETNRRYLLLMVYLDYITFNEELNYTYPYNTGGQPAGYQPR
ncbi:spore coat protein GerQ [Sediminibacillus albus]|uniref:Spore germination protein Q n=1 Tax=Sediminibacillus albus TaxID=407036 RepID=A0A1G8ZMK7_9BACI|nr:spore coat protein GerQ [Sediminibacillus albus]SDK16288.1 spore germination protein Q [Sediminibacillus albus]